MDKKAMYKLSYGLFVLTAREEEKDNGCIINTAIQAASDFEKVIKKAEVKKIAANKYAGTQTEKNLQEAFAGESQARNKYTYLAAAAKFRAVGESEKHHEENY